MRLWTLTLALGQVLGSRDADRRIGAIFAGSRQGVTPERKVLPGITSDDGKLFTDSARFPCYRLYLTGKQLERPAEYLQGELSTVRSSLTSLII